MKIFMIDHEKCTGCRQCELMCSFVKHQVFNRMLSNIRVVTDEAMALNVPVKCMQCENYPCINSCPTGALYRDSETAAVLTDHSKCIKCKACIMACPFGCVSLIHPANGKQRISICDLCSGDPSCVKVCREEAIFYIEEKQINTKKRKSTFRKIAQLQRLERASNPGNV